MAVVALKTEPKCKLCQHPQRADIDALLEKRSNREKDEQGVLVNGDYVLTQLAAWGVTNPTRENISTHWRKHCERVTGDRGEALDEGQAKALDELMAIIDSEEYPDNMDGQLQRLWDLGLAEIKRRIMRGDTSGITADQMRWIAAERTRRRDNDARNDLLGALVTGAAKAIASGAGSAAPVTVSARPQPELEPAPEVEDAEWTEADG